MSSSYPSSAAGIIAELSLRKCFRQKLHEDAEYLPMPDSFSGPPGQSSIKSFNLPDTLQKYPTMVSIDKLIWSPPVDKSKFFPPPLQLKE